MPIMPCRRLIAALTLSLSLHFLAAGSFDAWMRMKPALPRIVMPPIEASLADPQVEDALLKDTLAEKTLLHKEMATRPSGNGRSTAREMELARRKLSRQLFYPPEAVAQGLEGEVRLLLSLDSAGNITDVEIASSSGHPLLDRAAIDAAHAMGRLRGIGVREMILPVNFRLQ